MEKPPESSDDRKFTIEDVKSAENVGDALEAYRRASEKFENYSDLVDLQTAVADKMHRLGDEDKSSQFTILASQTRNTERSARVAISFEDGVGDFGTRVNRFGDQLDVFGRSADKIVGAADEFKNVGSRIASAASQMDDASRRMQAR